jgi:autonomous glycyl radical cofactor GrcA
VAEDVVVKDQLTPDMVAAGDELTRRLRQDPDFGLVCSLWLYTSESNNWKLVVATPIAESSGPIHAYQLIQGIIGEDWPADLEMHLYTISVLRSNHSFVTAIRSLGHFEIQELPSGPRPSSTVRVGKRITLTRIQDVFIEDALIYFIK